LGKLLQPSFLNTSQGRGLSGTFKNLLATLLRLCKCIPRQKVKGNKAIFVGLIFPFPWEFSINYFLGIPGIGRFGGSLLPSYLEVPQGKAFLALSFQPLVYPVFGGWARKVFSI